MNFLRFSKMTRPSLHGPHDGGEVVVGQHYVRRFLADVGAGDAHGHPDVGVLERGGVVDPVPGHGHHRAPLLPGVTILTLSAGETRA